MDIVPVEVPVGRLGGAAPGGGERACYIVAAQGIVPMVGALLWAAEVTYGTASGHRSLMPALLDRWGLHYMIGSWMHSRTSSQGLPLGWLAAGAELV